MYITYSNYMQNYVDDNYSVHWYTLIHITYTYIIYNIYLMYIVRNNYMQYYIYNNYCVHWYILIYITYTHYTYKFHIQHISDVHCVQ